MIRRLIHKKRLTMRNPFKYWREHRRQRAVLKGLRHTASVFGIIATLQQKGLLRWSEKDRRLYIAEPLALVMLGRGGEAWRSFLTNVYLHVTNEQLNRLWQQHITDETRVAVQARKATGKPILPGELDSIRRAVRDGLQSDAVPLPKVEPFEFFVVADDVEGGVQATVTYVGDYNPDTENFQMAAWEDVKAALLSAKKE